jgi:hypothetical protein
MSQEYIGAIVLIIGAVLKFFRIEIPNESVEGLIAGLIAIYIAYRRYKRGDITIVGARKG